MRIVPEVRYELARKPQIIIENVKKALSRTGVGRLKLKVVLGGTAMGLPDVTVVAFTNFASRTGAQGTSNAKGEVSLSLSATTRKLDKNLAAYST